MGTKGGCMAVKKRALLFLSFFSCYIILNASYAAAEENPLLEEGISYYRQENYDEAIAVLKKVRAQDPRSTLAAYYLGLCYKQIQDFKKAEPHLTDAVTFTPKIKGALLELIEVAYQLDDVAKAEKYVAVAEQEGIRPAQTAFLKGLVLLKKGDNLSAVSSFEKAKSLDATLTQSADYQIGMAYLKEREFGTAREVFKEVVVLDPNSDTAVFASQYVEALEKRAEAEKPLQFTMGFSYEYDDNVILKPSDAAIAGDVANEDDTRTVTTFQGEYTHRFSDTAKIRGVYSFYWADQEDLATYDVISNSVSVTPSYYLPRASVNVPVSYNYTTVADDGYLATISVNPLVNYMVGDSHMAQAYAKYQNKQFLSSPLNADEDRDSHTCSGGLGWFWFFADNKAFVNARYELIKDNAEGNNWEYLGNKFSAMVLIPLLEKFKITGYGEAFFEDFSNEHSVYGKKREDDVYTGSCMLTYEIFKNTELRLRYTYVKDNSSLPIYEYERHIVSTGLEYTF